MFSRLILKRAMATVATKPMATTAASSTGLLTTLAGIVVVAPMIAFAPANSFDDLDCQSYCQQKLMEGV